MLDFELTFADLQEVTCLLANIKFQDKNRHIVKPYILGSRHL